MRKFPAVRKLLTYSNYCWVISCFSMTVYILSSACIIWGLWLVTSQRTSYSVTHVHVCAMFNNTILYTESKISLYSQSGIKWVMESTCTRTWVGIGQCHVFATHANWVKCGKDHLKTDKTVQMSLKPSTQFKAVRIALKPSERENVVSMPLGWPASRLCGPSLVPSLVP